LLLGPFCGRPACQYIVARQTGGVCSAAYLRGETVRVDNVHAFEGHIACDADTKSEVVVPLVYTGADGALRVLGVLDLDCVTEAGFDDVDVRALEKIAELVVLSCEWAKE
jgi:L-methionine (R)-S-oxide reductase